MPIARHNDVRLRCDGAFKNPVVRGITRDCINRLRRRNAYSERQQLFAEQLHVVRRHLELVAQNQTRLGHDGVGHSQLDLTEDTKLCPHTVNERRLAGLFEPPRANRVHRETPGR
jgi:hypothetical protein